MHPLVLASKSPRRQELLQKLNLPFTVIASEVDESISHHLPPEDIVTTLATRKARNVAIQFPHSVIIGSDTIVVHDGKIFGKPLDHQDAKRMLEQLSGCIHSVYTGVAVVHGKTAQVFYEKTDVEFWELSPADIERYIDSKEPFDKAGAYGIQGLGALLVKSIKGDYYSVVGLPISRLARVLFEMDLWASPK